MEQGSDVSRGKLDFIYLNNVLEVNFHHRALYC